MENEKKTIGIDQQIEAVTDMLPVIDKASKEVFEEVIRSLKYAKASCDYFKALCHVFADEEMLADKKQELAAKEGETLFDFLPKWAKEEIIDGIDDTECDAIFAAIHGAGIEAMRVPGQPIENQPDQDPEFMANLQDDLKNGIRYIRKRNRFKSGVRRFYVEVLTEETYPKFKLVPYRNEAERDEDFLDLLTVEGTKEYPVPDKK